MSDAFVKHLKSLYEHRIEFPLEDPPEYPWVGGKDRGWGKGARISNIPHPCKEIWIPFVRISELIMYELRFADRFRTEKPHTLAILVHGWEQELETKLRSFVEDDGNIVLYAQEKPEKPDIDSQRTSVDKSVDNSWADRNYKTLQRMWKCG